MLKNLKFIPNLEEFCDYSVSDDGKVYSHKSNKFLKTSLRKGNGCTYERIGMRSSKGYRKTFSVHRLVCMAFKYEEGCENLTVNHIDEDTLNNNVNNLEWMTSRDNIRYSQANKTYVGDPDTLTEEYNLSDYTLQEFADMYDVPLNTMWDILNKMGSVKNIRKRRVFDDDLRIKIAVMRDSGYTLKNVAGTFGCSESMVSKVFNEYKHQNSEDARKRSDLQAG